MKETSANSHLTCKTNWIFDLDNTLYPHALNLHSEISNNITKYICEFLDLKHDEAKIIQKKYYAVHGTTLNGLMVHYGVDPDDYLKKVHDIDYSCIKPDPALGEAIGMLPGRKFIFTNGDRQHAERTANRLGILDRFDDIFDIVASGLTPKPMQEAYNRFIEHHRIDVPNAVMFEDLPRNLSVPKALGMATVLVVPHDFEPTSLEKYDIGFEDDIDFVTDDLTTFLVALSSNASHGKS